MQDFKYDSEECDWQATLRRPAAAFSHQQTAGLTDRLGSAATSILDSSAALIDPSLAPPCSLLQSYSSQGAFHILAVCVFYLEPCVCVNACLSKKQNTAFVVMNYDDEMCKYLKKVK